MSTHTAFSNPFYIPRWEKLVEESKEPCNNKNKVQSTSRVFATCMSVMKLPFCVHELEKLN